ncbi:MAG: N-acetyl-gamma-glutamyl-phosphate reductase [Deltaproteobacteria bacterium]|nr:N-acetyl-gamma-glutamyl-phosphate reductase [Deltaproteobacteria bacterium]
MKSPRLKTAIIGASGYTGAELIRLLDSHPHFDLQTITAHSQAGKKLCDLYPHLGTKKNLVFSSYDEVKDEILAADVVFCGLPHGQSGEVLPGLRPEQLVIDIGSDFRLKDSSLYPQWYDREHVAPAELSKWCYGLPELFHSQIASSKRIANPGCYATATILAVAPLLKAGLICAPLVVNAASGTSGAGREPSPSMHFSHVYEDFRAYKVTRHQHTPEIEQALRDFTGKDIVLTFVPHLIPMSRGIFISAAAQTSGTATQADCLDCLRNFYAQTTFVSVVDYGFGTKEVRGSNQVLIGCTLDKRSNTLIINSAIDNLVKGASGQAIQNANIATGLGEHLGLSSIGFYP